MCASRNDCLAVKQKAHFFLPLLKAIDHWSNKMPKQRDTSDDAFFRTLGALIHKKFLEAVEGDSFLAMTALREFISIGLVEKDIKKVSKLNEKKLLHAVANFGLHHPDLLGDFLKNLKSSYELVNNLPDDMRICFECLKYTPLDSNTCVHCGKTSEVDPEV